MAKQEVKQESFYNSILFKVGLVFLGGLLVYFFYNSELKTRFLTTNTQEATKAEEVDTGCDESQSIQKSKDSVVRIIGEDGEGSGFIINKDGYILTNYHIVKGSQTPRVVLSDKTPIIGKTFNYDEQIDLAVVKIEKSDLEALTFGDSDKLTPGDALIGIGFPLGQGLPGDATVTKGTYSAKRQSDVAGLEYIQVDANLNEGNSGSPIINTCGEVMGVLTLVISDTEGLKFAISSKTAKSISESLVTTGPKELPKIEQSSSDTEYQLAIPVVQFYNYVSTRQLEYAYKLLSNNFRLEAGGKENFIRGYDSTLNVYLQDIRIDDSSINSVYVKVATADLVGERVLFRIFEGTWILTQEDGEWKLDKGNIREIKQ